MPWRSPASGSQARNVDILDSMTIWPSEKAKDVIFLDCNDFKLLSLSVPMINQGLSGAVDARLPSLTLLIWSALASRWIDSSCCAGGQPRHGDLSRLTERGVAATRNDADITKLYFKDAAWNASSRQIVILFKKNFRAK